MQTAAVSMTAENQIRAICDEIGERLSYTLGVEAGLPPRLQMLLDRLAELDCHAPSLVPAIQEIKYQSFAVVAHAA